MLFFKSSKEHLKQVNESYSKHGRFAIKWGLYLIYTGCVSIIHGIVPAVFKFTAPRNVMKLARMIEQRGDPRELENS